VADESASSALALMALHNTMRYTVIPDLDASAHVRHSLHSDKSVWVEKNCYVDLWIELLYALKLEPLAILPFTAALDFEGDQWTFFKPSLEELRDLYGVDVQEMNVWRPLIEHAKEHLSAGKLISTEADAYWLPDTSGTDYRLQHTKTTIVLSDLDVASQRLGYFHNAGYYTLEGEDFVRTFRLNVAPDPTFLPLYAELIRLDGVVHRPRADLVEISRGLWRRHLRRRPEKNPIRRFQKRFDRDLPAMQAGGLAHYHAWAFGTTRQLGAAFELAAANLRWLQEDSTDDFATPVAAFESIASISKAFILKGARAVNARRDFDSAGIFEQMAAQWEQGMQSMSTLMATTS
jgi:hypothetical protein